MFCIYEKPKIQKNDVQVLFMRHPKVLLKPMNHTVHYFFSLAWFKIVLFVQSKMTIILYEWRTNSELYTDSPLFEISELDHLLEFS